MDRWFKRILVAIALLGIGHSAHALSFALDSIAEWGKFPRFCIGVYRWGDKFFNGYDTTYVEGTGKKFNLKLRTDSWVDIYNFSLPNSTRLQMISQPSTSAGLWLTYMAVSVGYDVNFSQIFGTNTRARERWSFGFNCALFSADAYLISNDVGTRIRRLTADGTNVISSPYEFDGVNTSSWGINAYYFINHKRYSHAAAFNMSRLQRKSQGSFIAGFAYSAHKYDFDFSTLPTYMRIHLPSTWDNYRYTAYNHNYDFIMGYGFNWSPNKHITIGIFETPYIGWRTGHTTGQENNKASFSLANRAKIAIVWNGGPWFASLNGQADTNIIYNKEYTLDSSYLAANFSFGYRFNLW